MKVHILGTAAAERIPAMFCKCTVCQNAMKTGGRNARSQTQVLIDDDLLIDFGQDTYLHFLQTGRDLTKVKHMLITHSHGDHYVPGDFMMTNRGHGNNDISQIAVYGNEECKELFNRVTTEKKAVFVQVKPYETYEIGDYQVTPLPAVHGTRNPYCYIIEKDGKSLLYNLDTEIFPDAVYEFIRQKQFAFDMVLCDGTYFALAGHYGTHMSLFENVAHRDRLAQMGALKENTQWIVTHFSHNGLHKGEKPLTVPEMWALADTRKGNFYTAQDMEALCQSYGMICAYDGILAKC